MPIKEGYRSTNHTEGKLQANPGNKKKHRAGSPAPSGKTKAGITGNSGKMKY